MPRYTTVLVGCGPRGMMHAQAIQANPERFALTAVCDLDSARLTPFAAQFNILTLIPMRTPCWRPNSRTSCALPPCHQQCVCRWWNWGSGMVSKPLPLKTHGLIAR